MTAVSDFLENALINHIFRATAYSSPANVYLALYTVDPTDADTGTEVTGGSYARQDLTGVFSAPSGGSTSNGSLISFPTATANWGTVTHAAIRDASTGGNLLWHGQLSASRTVNNGDTFTVPIGDLTVALT